MTKFTIGLRLEDDDNTVFWEVEHKTVKLAIIKAKKEYRDFCGRKDCTNKEIYFEFALPGHVQPITIN